MTFGPCQLEHFVYCHVYVSHPAGIPQDLSPHREITLERRVKRSPAMRPTCYLVLGGSLRSRTTVAHHHRTASNRAMQNDSET